MTIDNASLARLGRLVDANGIDADPVALVELAVAARDLGVGGVLVELMLDPFEPPAPRLRAFANVSMWAATALDGSEQWTSACPSYLDELVHSD